MQTGWKVSLAYSLMGNPPEWQNRSYRNKTFHRVTVHVDASVVTASHCPMLRFKYPRNRLTFHRLSVPENRPKAHLFQPSEDRSGPLVPSTTGN